MGYYVNIVSSDIFVDKNDFEKLYNKLCELNDYHELKRGGSFGGNQDNIEGERYPRDKWFSWMPYNYPETCKTMQEILILVGFELEFDNDGNLIGLGYNDKTGNEEYFLTCFIGLTKPGSYVEFKGEEDEHYYRFIFTNDSMISQVAKISYEWHNDEELKFGQMTSVDIDLKKWREELNNSNMKIKGDDLNLENF